MKAYRIVNINMTASAAILKCKTCPRVKLNLFYLLGPVFYKVATHWGFSRTVLEFACLSQKTSLKILGIPVQDAEAVDSHALNLRWFRMVMVLPFTFSIQITYLV